MRPTPTLMPLPDGYAEIARRASSAAAEVAPFASETDESATLDPRLLETLRRTGLSRFVVPAAFGGETERVDPVAICVIREILMSESSHLDSLFSLQGIGSYALTVAGSAEQRAAWLPRVANAEALAALAITEPDAGSDLRALSSTITERAGTLHLSGTKTAISNAGVAAFYTVLAREGDGLSAVLLPAETRGLEYLPGPEFMAAHIGGTLSIDVDLPLTARIGPPGRGLAPVLATLSVFRVSVAAQALGLARKAIDVAVAHADTRTSGGQPLARLPAVAELLARSWTELEMARLLTYRVAELARANTGAGIAESSMAKVAAAEMAGRVVDRCVQVMGRFGVERGGRMERLYRQARAMRIYEGASEALWPVIGRELFSEKTSR
jgi:acyl-CoA dehydrogenase